MIEKMRGVLAIGLTIVVARSALADLYVVQVGDGAAALSNASTAAFVQKFSDSGGTPLSTISLPTTASGSNQPLTLLGTATTEGFLALSSNGQYLTLGGYGIGPGTTAVPQTDA